MYSKVETITPIVAKVLLERNSKNNRTINQNTVKAYADTMKNGDWQLTPQGISFAKDGRLIDGQHRLAAIVKADIPVAMYVTYDCENTIDILDRGRGRSDSDVLHMAGINVKAAETAAFNFMCRYIGENIQRRDPACKRFFEKNLDSMRSAYVIICKGSNKGVLRTAAATAAVWSALLFGEDAEMLGRFATVTNSGFSESDEESSAIVLRNYLLTNHPRVFPEYVDIFKMIQTAIKCFSDKKPRRMMFSNIKSVYFDRHPAEVIVREALSGK